MLEADRLRAKAQHCRTIARSCDTQGTKKTLQVIAEECEAKAEKLDRRAPRIPNI